MTDLVLKYYGVDWLEMIMSFLFVYYIGNKKRYGFIFGIVANLAWMTFGFMTGSIANIIANFVFIAPNLRGYIKWGNAKPTDKERIYSRGRCTFFLALK
jgi:nicotinamide riboside transporter PnuC